MRFVIATALLCACTAIAQDHDGGDDYDQELQARDIRDQIWKAAHGGPPTKYHGFQEMAHNYPGHPLKSFGANHPHDVEDENGLGDDEGFIGDAEGFANNVARSIRNAYKTFGNKAEESVQHAKAKAGYRDGGKHFAGHGKGGPWKLGPREVEDEGEGPGVWEEGFDDDDDDEKKPYLAARDVGNEEDEGEVDWNPDPADFDMEDDDGDGDAELAERDVEGDEEVDWNLDPAEFDMGDDDEADDADLSKRDVEAEYDEGEDFDDDEGQPEEVDVDETDVPELAERDVEENEDDEVDDVENDANAPALTAFDDDDEDIPDPKLMLEEEFDEGLTERDEEGGLFERDAEPEAFNFFGLGGKKGDHKGPGHAHHGGQHSDMKQNIKHIYARDAEDDSFEGAHDPISEDVSDEEFYVEDGEADESGADEAEDEEEDGLEKREAEIKFPVDRGDSKHLMNGQQHKPGKPQQQGWAAWFGW